MISPPKDSLETFLFHKQHGHIRKSFQTKGHGRVLPIKVSKVSLMTDSDTENTTILFPSKTTIIKPERLSVLFSKINNYPMPLRLIAKLSLGLRVSQSGLEISSRTQAQGNCVTCTQQLPCRPKVPGVPRSTLCSDGWCPFRLALILQIMVTFCPSPDPKAKEGGNPAPSRHLTFWTESENSPQSPKGHLSPHSCPGLTDVLSQQR